MTAESAIRIVINASSCRPRRVHGEKLLPSLGIWALTALCTVMMALGCGTPHSTLDITAPSTAKAGTPFTITVTTLYRGQPDTVINSPIVFTSSDPSAVLPGYYTFTPADAGSHTWINGVTLMTPGKQTISATIVMATGINGTVEIMVSSATAAD